MAMNNPYDFTEWHEDRLEDRMGVLMELEQLHQHPRAEQIAKELAYIIFELTAREQYDA